MIINDCFKQGYLRLYVVSLVDPKITLYNLFIIFTMNAFEAYL